MLMMLKSKKMLEVIISNLMLLLVTGIGGGQNEMIEYTFNCQEPSFVTPNVTACNTDKFQLICNESEVVVATICFGKSLPTPTTTSSAPTTSSRTTTTGSATTVTTSGSAAASVDTCSYSQNNCLDNYTASFDGTFITAIDQCLWTSSSCDFEVTHQNLMSLGETCEVSFFEGFNYLVAFDFQCVSRSIVFDICSNDTVTNTPEIGYIHSPGFPTDVFADPAVYCNVSFHTEDQKLFNFIIQYVYLDGSDEISITGLHANGSLHGHATAWTGVQKYHKNHSMEAHGFLVKYRHTYHLALDGFLLSFQVSDVPMTSPTRVTSHPPPPTSSKAPVNTSSGLWYRLLALVIITYCSVTVVTMM